MRRWHWLPLLTALVFTGCNTRPAPVPQPTQQTVTSPATTQPAGKTTETAGATPPSLTVSPNDEAGVISGVVRWEGLADPAIKDLFPADPSLFTVSIAGRKVPARLTPRLQIDSATGGVADTIVWLVNAPAGAAPPPEPLMLTQRQGDCQPHVLAAVKGAKLQFTTADDEAVLHAQGAENFDVTVRKGGKPAVRTLNTVGRIDVRSERAPWLSAYVMVFDHGHFAVTGAAGKFRLPRVPAGSYQLVLWHESWRFTDRSRFITTAPLQRQVQVEMPAGKGASVRWMLSAREAETLAK